MWYEGSGTETPNRHYLAADERGSVIAVMDFVDNEINNYTPFGASGVAAHEGRFGYTGQMYLMDRDLNLYHDKAQAYHPALGRFIQTGSIQIKGGIASLGEFGVDWIVELSQGLIVSFDSDSIVISDDVTLECKNLEQVI